MYLNCCSTSSITPPQSSHGHFAPYPRPQPVYAPTHRSDDDSSSSGSGSPPHFEQQLHQMHQQQQQQQVPTLAAGATPADFARFWAPANVQGQKVGAYPMGFAM